MTTNHAFARSLSSAGLADDLRDAERYRWLRATAVERSEYEDAKFIPCPVLVMTFIGVFDADRKEFDAAIDSAMAANDLAKPPGAALCDRSA